MKSSDYFCYILSHIELSHFRHYNIIFNYFHLKIYNTNSFVLLCVHSISYLLFHVSFRSI